MPDTTGFSEGVIGPPIPQMVAIPNGANGVPYTAVTLPITGGRRPYTFVIESGTLQLGMTLSAAGVLSGTPIATGAVTIGFRVTDMNGKVGRGVFSLTVV